MGKLEGKMDLPDTSYLRKDLIVSDVIYMPEKTQLLEEAEKLAIKKGKDEIAIISGIGTRNYYRKFGYERKGPYMAKKLI